jgi:hypothetical protein
VRDGFERSFEQAQAIVGPAQPQAGGEQQRNSEHDAAGRNQQSRRLRPEHAIGRSGRSREQQQCADSPNYERACTR